jgi:hypothetical protein
MMMMMVVVVVVAVMDATEAGGRAQSSLLY